MSPQTTPRGGRRGSPPSPIEASPKLLLGQFFSRIRGRDKPKRDDSNTPNNNKHSEDPDARNSNSKSNTKDSNSHSDDSNSSTSTKESSSSNSNSNSNSASDEEGSCGETEVIREGPSVSFIRCGVILKIHKSPCGAVPTFDYLIESPYAVLLSPLQETRRAATTRMRKPPGQTEEGGGEPREGRRPKNEAKRKETARGGAGNEEAGKDERSKETTGDEAEPKGPTATERERGDRHIEEEIEKLKHMGWSLADAVWVFRPTTSSKVFRPSSPPPAVARYPLWALPPLSLSLSLSHYLARCLLLFASFLVFVSLRISLLRSVSFYLSLLVFVWHSFGC